ncbi:MAG: DUF4139 domain-containing protein [Candidatus Competibacteraceae bacterium]|nr:DUF4139 domain-containing protein [Candidatus Competibacteraceae bacterium]
MTRSVLLRILCTVLLLGVLPLDAFARIKLITLPVRERVEIQLDHPDLTLVEEERIVPLVKGINQVDFAWANTRIDPDTLVFRVLAPADDSQLDVKVLSVSYPPNENALVWAVSASDSGAVRVRISYVLGGLDKQFHYRAVAANDEKTLTLSQYLRVKNHANEAYDQTNVWVGFGEQVAKPIGLNETKEVLLGKYRDVPLKKTYTSDPQQFGYLDRAKDKLNVPMHYVLKNEAVSGLGQASLPYGKARIFQDDGRGGTAFIGEDWGKFTPPEDEMALYLGLARDIVIKRTIEKNERERIAGNLYRHELIVKYEIENFKDTPAVLDLVERVSYLRNEVGIQSPRDPEWRLGKETTLDSSPDPEKSDFDKLTFHVDLPARAGDSKAQKQIHKLHLVLNNEW